VSGAYDRAIYARPGPFEAAMGEVRGGTAYAVSAAMRFLAALALLAIGFGAGWTFRDSNAPDAPVRAERQEASRGSEAKADETPEAPPPGYTSTPAPEAPSLAGDEQPDTPTEEPDPVASPESEEPDPEAKKLATFMRSMLPLLKMQSVREGRDEASELAKLLGLDEYREKQIAEAIANDKVRKLEEGVIPILEGKEADEEMIANLSETDGMTGALEKDLALVLNTHELDTVKTHYREQHEKSRREAIDAEVKGLAIPDLSEDQERELRTLLKAEQGDGVSMSSGTSTSSKSGFRMKMTKSLSKDGIVESLDDEYKQRREKLAVFLSTEQLAHLDKQHEEEREEAKAAAGMMGGLFGAISVGTKTETSKDG